MFILDGKIYIKYEEPPEEKPNANELKKQNTSSVRSEPEKKKEEKQEDVTSYSNLIAIDANTLEPI